MTSHGMFIFLGGSRDSGCRGASAIERRTSDGGATGAIRSPGVMLRETCGDWARAHEDSTQGFDDGI